MTEGNAIFLIGLIALALGLTVIAFAFKYMVLAYAAGLLWWIIGIERIVDRATAIDIPLAILFAVFGAGMFVAPIMISSRDKKPLEPKQNYSDYLASRIEGRRRLRKRYTQSYRDMLI